MKYSWGCTISASLATSIGVWSEYLLGARDANDPGVAAAARYLKDSGFKIPTKAMSTDLWVKFSILASEARDIQRLSVASSITKSDVKRIGAFGHTLGDVNDFFRTECGVELTLENPADNPKTYAQKDIVKLSHNTLKDLVELNASEFPNPGDFLEAVAPNLDRLHGSVTSDPAHDYSKIPAELTEDTVGADARDVIGKDVTDKKEVSDYVPLPPPPLETKQWWEEGKGE